MKLYELNKIFKQVYYNYDHLYIKPISYDKESGLHTFSYPFVTMDKITYGGKHGDAFALESCNEFEESVETYTNEIVVRFKISGDHIKKLNKEQIGEYFRLLVDNVHDKFYKMINPHNEVMFGTAYGFEIPGEKDLFIRPIQLWKGIDVVETGDYEVRMYADVIVESEIEF